MKNRRGRNRRSCRSLTGMTLIEVILTVGVLGILALLGSRPLLCHLSESKMASQISDLNYARDAVETFKAEFGDFPATLEEAYKGPTAPPHLIYCVDDPDVNSGHGNEFCTFFDPENPGGNPPQSAPQAGYILLTQNDLCPCKNIDYLWVSCCGMEPDVVEYGEESGVPGHPGKGPTGPGG